MILVEQKMNNWKKKQHPTSTKQSETCQSSQKSVTFGVLFPMFCPTALDPPGVGESRKPELPLVGVCKTPATPNMSKLHFARDTLLMVHTMRLKHQHHKKHCKI